MFIRFANVMNHKSDNGMVNPAVGLTLSYTFCMS